MTKPTLTRFALKTAPLAVVVLAAAVSGCTNTYGTGKSPGLQTVEDIVGIAALSNEPKEPIDYRPRAAIVAPPDTSALPPPGAGDTAPLAANWPVDPDAQRAQLRADAAAREAAGLPTPKFSLPKSEQTGPVVMRDAESEALASTAAGGATAGNRDEVRKLFADARGGVAVDENGNPVRRYLTDPPAEYRMPDPTAPVEIVEKPKPKKPFKWWWQ